MNRWLFIAFAFVAALESCSTTSSRTDAADAAADSGVVDSASMDTAAACDPPETYDAGPDGSLPPGRFVCYADVGGDALVLNCQLPAVCCEKKQVCYDRSVEPRFCDHPYCP